MDIGVVHWVVTRRAQYGRRIFLWLLLAAAVVFAFGGCYSEPEDRLSSRLNRFLDLLNVEEKQNIADGLYTEAAASLTARVEGDAALAENYRNLLASEDIPFFNYKQAIQFFAGSLDGRIRFLRFVKILEEPELLAFNKGLRTETAELLLARLENNPGLAREYAEHIAPKRKRMNDQELVDAYTWAKNIMPFITLYSGMNEIERKQLVGGDIAQAVRSFASRRQTEQKVQQTLENIRVMLPETMALEHPENVFEAAALGGIQDGAMRLSLAALADNAALGKRPSELLAEAKALGVVFPIPTEMQKRQEDLEGDIIWFKYFVDEKIDFYAN